MHEKAAQLSHDYRPERGNTLTPFQASFKWAWKLLETRPVSHRDYSTNVQKWICACGSQKIHAFHLCKHLVHATGKPNSDFFRHIHCCRVFPLYRDSFLRNETDNVGSVTNGNNYGPDIKPLANLKRAAEDNLPNSRSEKHV